MHDSGTTVTRKQQFALLIAVAWIAITAAVAYVTHSLAFVGGMLGLLSWILLPLGKNASVLGRWREVWITITATLVAATLSLIAGRLIGIDQHIAVAVSCGVGISVGLFVNHRMNVSANR